MYREKRSDPKHIVAPIQDHNTVLCKHCMIYMILIMQRYRSKPSHGINMYCVEFDRNNPKIFGRKNKKKLLVYDLLQNKCDKKIKHTCPRIRRSTHVLRLSSLSMFETSNSFGTKRNGRSENKIIGF